MNQGSINGGSEIVLYEAADGGVRLDVKLEQETVWLTQLQMATLFDTTPENVLMHLKNVYAEKKLAERSTTKGFLAVRTESKRRVADWLRQAIARLNPNLPANAIEDALREAVGLQERLFKEWSFVDFTKFPLRSQNEVDLRHGTTETAYCAWLQIDSKR